MSLGRDYPIFHRKIGLEMLDKKKEQALVPTTVHRRLQPPTQQAEFSAPPAVVCPCAAAGLAPGDLPFGCQLGLALFHVLPGLTQIHSYFPDSSLGSWLMLEAYSWETLKSPLKTSKYINAQ